MSHIPWTQRRLDQQQSESNVYVMDLATASRRKRLAQAQPLNRDTVVYTLKILAGLLTLSALGRVIYLWGAGRLL